MTATPRRRAVATAATIAAAAAALAAGSVEAATAARYSWWISPSGNLVCRGFGGTPIAESEVACYAKNLGTAVAVTGDTGKLRVFKPARRWPPPGASTEALYIGQDFGVANVECRMRQDGVRCLSSLADRGFLIGRAGWKRIVF